MSYFVRVTQIVEVDETAGLTPSAALQRGREIWEGDPTAHPATLEVFDHPSCEGSALDPEADR